MAGRVDGEEFTLQTEAQDLQSPDSGQTIPLWYETGSFRRNLGPRLKAKRFTLYS